MIAVFRSGSKGGSVFFGVCAVPPGPLMTHIGYFLLKGFYYYADDF